MYYPNVYTNNFSDYGIWRNTNFYVTFINVQQSVNLKRADIIQILISFLFNVPSFQCNRSIVTIFFTLKFLINASINEEYIIVSVKCLQERNMNDCSVFSCRICWIKNKCCSTSRDLNEMLTLRTAKLKTTSVMA